MGKGCSYVELSAAKVRELALACLDFVQRTRDNSKRKSLERKKRSIQKDWIERIGRRWFGWSFPSDKEIERQLDVEWEDRDFDPSWVYIGREEKAIAKKLLNAAEYAEKVTVSTYDLYMITTAISE